MNTGALAGVATGLYSSSAGPRSYREDVLRDAPIGFWPLNEALGSVAKDQSGGGRDGTYSGTVALAVAGPGGRNAVSLGAGAGYVELGDAAAFSPSGAISVEIWVKRTAAGVRHDLVSKYKVDASNNEFSLVVASDNTIAFTLLNTGAGTWRSFTTSSTLTDTAGWHHVVGTYDGSSTMAVYLDGASQAGTPTGPSGTRSGDTTANLRLGRRDDNGGALTGSLALAAMYGSALTLNRIQSHYAIGSIIGN